jgi:hypothetical protein
VSKKVPRPPRNPSARKKSRKLLAVIPQDSQEETAFQDREAKMNFEEEADVYEDPMNHEGR